MNLTTEKWVDRIIVMKDGCINEFGSNEELYSNKGFYYNWLKEKTILL
jgi:ABC-type multidrug transport system fused ATPase/permease subunit